MGLQPQGLKLLPAFLYPFVPLETSMTLSVQDAISSRVSVNRFQTNQPLDDATIALLADLATKAPSAYNLQNWRLVVTRSQEAKARLQAAAYGQQKIADASAVFIVCGTLEAHKQLASALAPSLEAGIMEKTVADAWQSQACRSHEGNYSLQRDEAVRSASLAAMTLMLAAQSMGLGSCAMSGFDAAQVAQEFGLSSTELPVMIVAIGYPELSGNWPQKPRKPLSDVLSVV